MSASLIHVTLKETAELDGVKADGECTVKVFADNKKIGEYSVVEATELEELKKFEESCMVPDPE